MTWRDEEFWMCVLSIILIFFSWFIGWKMKYNAQYRMEKHREFMMSAENIIRSLSDKYRYDGMEFERKFE